MRAPVRKHEAVPQLGAVEYGFVIVAGVLAFALNVGGRRDRHDRDGLRAHVRRLSGPT
jgi:hypothetical protein